MKKYAVGDRVEILRIPWWLSKRRKKPVIGIVTMAYSSAICVRPLWHKLDIKLYRSEVKHAVS
jgi:hypothetical protein